MELREDGLNTTTNYYTVRYHARRNHIKIKIVSVLTIVKQYVRLNCSYFALAIQD